MCDTATIQARIRQKKSIPWALEAKPEVEIWRRPVFLTQRQCLSICPKVGQSTQLLPVLQIHFRFDHDDFLHAFFELRSISRHFGPFRALLKVLPVSELYFRATDLDLVHQVFLSKAFLAVHVRYGDNAGQNKAKKSVQGAVEAKPEVEIWRRPVVLTQRPRLSICPKVGQSTQQSHFHF